jgi:predicted nucleic-acid-binding protein
MIGLDTHVLVRYIMQDDVAQAAQAVRVIEALTVDEPGLMTMVSVVELVSVLGACYHLDREQITVALETLLRTKVLLVERAEVIWQAVRAFRDSQGDFADCLIERCAAAAGCERTLTFDRGAAKQAGMCLIS